MKLPSSKAVATAITYAKVAIAAYGVFASIRNLITSVNEARGRSRLKVLYVDSRDVPADKLDDYYREAEGYLRTHERPRKGGYARRRGLASKRRRHSKDDCSEE